MIASENTLAASSGSTALPYVGSIDLACAPLKLLAYVHLRNIHASTGAGRVARQLTEHLALRKDISVRILADAGDRARIVPLVQQPWSDFKYHTFSSDTSKQQARWFAIDRPFAESFWPEAQVVFCTGESYVPTRKARLAITVHDAAYFEEGAHRHDKAFWKQRLKWNLLFSKLSRKADMFHTVSQFSADRLAHFFPSITPRLRVVHNAVTPHFFEPVPSEGKRYLTEIGLADRRFVLIPGGLHFRKNADLILDACPDLLRRFPDLVVAVVNHSDPTYAERAAPLGSNFRLLGFVDEEALHALYAAAAIVWFPSRYEGFGMPVIEAMACGTPVVASSASSLPEIAGDAAILVDPSRPAAHVNALDNLLTDSLACKQLSLAGETRASRFTWDSSANQLKHYFDELL
jgi:glycosyltransferase involved in cell wall biosynthesis